MYINSNIALTEIDGFTSITSIGGRFEIRINNDLESIDGFSSLSTLGNYFNVTQNNSLLDIDGFSSLTSVSSHFLLGINPMLTNIDGLASLSTIGSVFQIYSSPSLTNLDSLHNLSSVASNLNIAGNTSLTSFCGLFPIIDGGGIAGSFNASGNANNPTQAEIIADGSCIEQNYQIGSIYFATLTDAINDGGSPIILLVNKTESAAITLPAGIELIIPEPLQLTFE